MIAWAVNAVGCPPSLRDDALAEVKLAFLRACPRLDDNREPERFFNVRLRGAARDFLRRHGDMSHGQSVQKRTHKGIISLDESCVDGGVPFGESLDDPTELNPRERLEESDRPNTTKRLPFVSAQPRCRKEQIRLPKRLILATGCRTRHRWWQTWLAQHPAISPDPLVQYFLRKHTTLVPAFYARRLAYKVDMGIAA